jgi:hypothetical protein
VTSDEVLHIDQSSENFNEALVNTVVATAATSGSSVGGNISLQNSLASGLKHKMIYSRLSQIRSFGN